jgi:hypothetical protein
MAVAPLRTKWPKGMLASLLLLVFFGSQVFSCCLVNQRLGQFLKTAFTARAQTQMAGHSCCPKSSEPASDAQGAGQDASRHQGCCIQDANQKLPQIPSEQAQVPVLPDLVIGILAKLDCELPRIPVRPDLLVASSPPVYLTQLRLLI